MSLKSIINYKLGFIFLCVFFSLNTTNAQQQTSDFWNHVRFGGGIGLNFGDGFFSGTIAPSAVYEFNDAVALGLGLNGTFNKQKSVYKSKLYTQTIYIHIFLENQYEI